ncbi:MAG: ABC transporter permease subunit [Rhodospirillaceae bacterium]|nr:ABC transporter permease subunit [Rhodospirillaceae bacterium]
MRPPELFGLFAVPRRLTSVVLIILPFIAVIALYWIASDIRLADNPQDKLLPSFRQMGDAVWRMAFEPDVRTGTYLWWADTFASLRRLAIGLSLSAMTALFLGLNVGMFPGLRFLCLPFLTVVSIIPPLSILPILFITVGVDEVAKIVLIYIGTVFLMTRDMTLTTTAIPREQVTKALTLGASELGVVYRVIMPQVMPRLINALRLSLGAAWLFLIAAEAIVATEGLGYRIFLVRRYLSMDVILPYVAWITLLGFTIDWLLRMAVRRFYPWYARQGS